MEQTRVVVAIVLCFLVLLGWQMFFVDTGDVAPEGVQSETAKSIPPAEGVGVAPAQPLETIPATTERLDVDNARTPDVVTVNTPYYTIRITEKGAAVQSFKLKDYRETVDADSDLKELIDPANTTGTILVAFERHSIQGLDTAVFTHQAALPEINVSEKSERVLFRWQSRDGVVVEKAYVFSPDSYLIDVEVSVENRSQVGLVDQLALKMIDTVPADAPRIGFTGPSAMVDGQVQELKLKKITEKNRLTGAITWTAFQDRYFMSTIIPSATANMVANYTLKEGTFLESRVVLPETTIPQNTQKTFAFQVYFGPKNIDLLKGMGHKLERVVDFGWVDWLARPCLWVMNLIYRVVPNYGLAIILLTILIKAALWPLGNKSYKSMGQMKKMQPLMAEIRERYKDDKQKMNVELMALYKTYKVNPLGGCLPMLVQLPVLYAFYMMLYHAVELRHAPFGGWIQDLSAPERLFNFAFSIPFMQDPAGIPVLTILMGASMFVQQKMQPPMGDPAQAKMMMFMPVFLIVIGINFSSGLVLYWFISNILSILQQYYVTKKTA